MDKNLNYTIGIILIDRASGGADGLNRRLQLITQSARQATQAAGQLGGRLLVVSVAAVSNFRQADTQVDALRNNLEQIRSAGQSAAGGLGQVGDIAPRFNALNMSIQQVARELPAFAYSASTGFMAISNNLPILADAISNVRKENAALVAAGKTVVPVWRQVASSLLSWQTALALGITALTMYAPQIISFVRNLFDLSDGANESRRALEALRSTTQSYGESLLQETNQLRYIYEAINQTAEGTAARRAAIQTLNDTYKEYMPYLLSEKSSLEELNSMYNILNSALRNHIALKVRNAQLDKITEEAAKAQSDAIADLQEALSAQGASTSLSDDIITTLVNDAPKWKAAGDTLREAFLQAVRNIQTDSGITISRDAEQGIYAYIRSFYEMDTAVNAVNKRIDLLLGKNDQIKELGTLVVTPDANKDTEKELNKNLETIGGLTNKINQLKEAKSRASAETAANLEREIQLYQERLNVLQQTINRAAAGNLGDEKYKEKLNAPDIEALEVPAVNIPITFDTNRLRENFRIMQQMFSDSIKEMTVLSSEQITGLLSQSFASIGTAIASGDVLESFKSTLIMLMDMLQQFGTALIAAGVASEALKVVAWSGIGAIIAGGALVAATAAAKAALNRVTAFADGGIVSGPTLALVGEYAGASSNPEVIAPLNKLKSMIEPAVQNDTVMNGEVRFVIRGEVLEGILQKMNRKRMRTR